jgi:hypothetical protein
VLSAALSGCDAVGQAVATPSMLQCGRLLADECEAVARTALSRLDLVRTGPIEAIVVTRLDCLAVAETARREAWRDGRTCWVVDATGQRAHGFVALTRRDDGSFETVMLGQ